MAKENKQNTSEVMEEIERVWQKQPHLRCGQFLMYLLSQYKIAHGGRDAFYIEDNKFVEWLKTL